MQGKKHAHCADGETEASGSHGASTSMTQLAIETCFFQPQPHTRTWHGKGLKRRRADTQGAVPDAHGEPLVYL